MRKRRQVLLEEEELQEVQLVARNHQLTTAEWVRQSLRRAVRAGQGAVPRLKLETIARAAEHDYPVSDIETMLDEIEAGYASRDLELDGSWLSCAWS